MNEARNAVESSDRTVERIIVVERGPTFNPGTAAVLSLFFPGVGQMYRGQVLAGFLWMGFVPVGYLCFIIPGVILHLLCIFLAAQKPSNGGKSQ